METVVGRAGERAAYPEGYSRKPDNCHHHRNHKEYRADATVDSASKGDDDHRAHRYWKIGLCYGKGTQEY